MSVSPDTNGHDISRGKLQEGPLSTLKRPLVRLILTVAHMGSKAKDLRCFLRRCKPQTNIAHLVPVWSLLGSNLGSPHFGKLPGISTGRTAETNGTSTSAIRFVWFGANVSNALGAFRA